MINAFKLITKNECEWIDIKENSPESINERELSLLVNYLKKQYGDKVILKFGYRKIMFINYVGYIQFFEFAIEILPKISLVKGENSLPEEERRVLIEMLNRSGYFRINIFEKSNALNLSISLLEVFASKYADLIYTEIVKGFYRDYITIEENANMLKGRLNVKNQIKNIARNISKAYCEFTEFSVDNDLNKIFKAAFKVLLNFVKNKHIKNKLKDCLNFFDEVDDTEFNPAALDYIVFDRRNERFKNAFILAKAIIRKLSYANKYYNCDAFSFLFEMNDLFEKYVASLVKSLFASGAITDYKIQDNTRYLLKNMINDSRSIKLRPDILIYKNTGRCLIIDTKWKSPLNSNNLIAASTFDLYQMYAYVTKYSDAVKGILLYPYMENAGLIPEWEASQEKTIALGMITLDKYENSILDLKTLLN